MKFRLFLTLSLFSFILFSCKSVNNLEKYDLKEKKFYFDTQVSSDVKKIRIDDDYITDDNSTNKNKSGAEKVIDAIGSIGTTIGKALTENTVREKLNTSVNPSEIAKGVSEGFENTLIQYLNIQKETDIKGNYDYIVNTLIDDISINSNSYGIFVNVRAMCTIISRNDGKIVWQDRESESGNLRHNYSSSKSTVFNDIIQISSLSSLSEKELHEAIIFAAIEAGRKIGDEFRDELSELSRNN